MAKKMSREIHLKNRPLGMPSLKDFELVEVPIPEVGKGQILVRNIYI
jgi:NADPH-dependent curcumin reductase CurA